MIYVRKVSYFIEETKEVLSLLKIGYCMDSVAEKRNSNYVTENPLSKLIYEIKGGTYQHEQRLHFKFKKYLYSGKEWFIDCNDIHNFFKTATLEDLDKLPEVIRKNKLKQGSQFIKVWNKNLPKIYYLISKLYKLTYTEDKIPNPATFYNILLDIREKFIYKIDKIFEYLLSLPDFSYLKDTISFREVTSWEEKEKVICEKILNNKYWEDKMKIACEIYEENKENLSYIPEPFKSYIKIFGITNIKTFCYRRGLLNRNLSEDIIKIPTDEELSNMIYNTFRVGEKYTISTIKSTLNNIYKQLNIFKKAKSTDLKKWFDIKNVGYKDGRIIKILNKL